MMMTLFVEKPYSDPHNPLQYLERAHHFVELKYPDLAAADAYRALTLLETLEDGTAAYPARKSNAEEFSGKQAADLLKKKPECYRLLVDCLLACGCLRDAFGFWYQWQSGTRATFEDFAASAQKVKGKPLKEHGTARRDLYSWNNHEPNRSCPETLQLLNERLKSVAPKCEVRSVSLPVLSRTTVEPSQKTVTQLGLFATADIVPGEQVLHETSLLTATNRVYDTLCDACNGLLPDLAADFPPVPCDKCHDTIFCSEKCHDLAQETYHPAICGGDVEALASIGRNDLSLVDAADSLYFLLIGRAIAMAETQDVHPLDLSEVKYIWGDLTNVEEQKETLPFSFQMQILWPQRLLEEMGIDPFASLPRYDTWVLNTMYAKFRGTASGRLSKWDGGPEVSAVHPMWCLANHSCDPNVRWEWGGEIVFNARSERVAWGHGETPRNGGIRAGEEILNHYCDIRLPTKERRSWAVGALGGDCMCGRCVWEAGEGATRGAKS